MRFTTVVEQHGRSATGLPVPPEVVEALGGGGRPAVTVTLGGHTYRTTVGTMAGRRLLPLAAEHRTAAGVAAGQEVEVDVELDEAPREVELPEDLARAVAEDERASATLAGLAPSHRKEWVRWVTSAAKEETRASRVARTVEALREGRRAR
jgi:hypothetical protein